MVYYFESYVHIFAYVLFLLDVFVGRTLPCLAPCSCHVHWCIFMIIIITLLIISVLSLRCILEPNQSCPFFPCFTQVKKLSFGIVFLNRRSSCVRRPLPVRTFSTTPQLIRTHTQMNHRQRQKTRYHAAERLSPSLLLDKSTQEKY